jgi:hypothetical protein
MFAVGGCIIVPFIRYSEIEKPLEERIETFTKDIKIPEGCEGVYPVNKKLAYYYLDRKTGKLVIASL